MKPKSKPFSEGTFDQDKSHGLTPKMIDALLEAIDKQKNNIPFGPANIKGSLITLIARCLIIREKISVDGESNFQWQVTDEAITLLQDSGIDV